MATVGSRTPTQTAWLGLALLLLGVLLLGGGWLAWRGATRTNPPSPTLPTASSSHAPATTWAPDLVDGVPWGWPPTADGAVAAAVTAVAATGQPEAVFDANRFATIADVVFTPEQARAHADEVEAARAQLEVPGWAQQPESRRMYYFTPLAVRLMSFDPVQQAATVEVWAMTVVGVGDSGGAFFTTSTVELATDPGTEAWQVTRLDSEEGPIPLVIETASAPGRTRAFLREAAPILPLPLGSWQ